MPDFTGSSGDDSYWGGPEGERIEGLGGRDYLLGNGGDDQIFGGDGNDNLHGGDGNDLLEGGEGDDLLQGNEGSDILRGMAGNDRLLLNPQAGVSSLAGESIDGGDGVDTLQFDGLFLSTAITFSIANPLIAQNLAGATVVGVERLSFRSGSGNDDITGGALDDYIDGFDGNDRIDGGLGNDNLDGGFGTDTIYGGGGNDTIRGGSGGINDVLYGGEGDDTFFWNQDALIDGGSGIDLLRIDYSVAGTGLTADLSNPNVETMVLGTRVIGVEQLWFYAGSGNDSLTGGSGADVLVGNGGNDILVGGGGNDNLSGGDGNDQLSGGAGDDFLHNYTSDVNPADMIDGGEGFDTLEFRATSATGPITIDLLATTGMVTNVEQIFFSGGSGTNHVSGGAAGDTFWGGVSGDHFDGRGGDDDIRGNDGDDVIFGGDGNDYVEGGAGADSLSGGAGDDILRGMDDNDSLDGGEGADELSGDNGNDAIFGNDGNDTLVGDVGSDVLTGGAGNDTFGDTADGLNGDTITDFTAADRIVFSDANLDSFTFSLSGSTLTYSGRSLTLTGVSGTLVASAAAGGGVQLSLVADVRNDFNGDGRSDILWRNLDGQMSNWLGQANGGFVQNNANAAAVVPTSWQIAGTGDFNGDGRDDILWRNTDGQLSNWLATASGGFTQNNANAAAVVPTSWTVVGTGDFNGDGRDDILWRNTDGTVSNWLGTASGGFTPNDANAARFVPTSWTVVGTGDFNGDGRDDILWRNSNGQVSDWLGQANGGFILNDANALTNVDTAWKVVGTGDFNGDGRDDILWRNDNGQLSNWLGQANGGFVNNGAVSGAFVPLAWSVVAIGDYNGDGRDDILWRNANGTVTDWLGNANGSFTPNDANAASVVPTAWHVQPEAPFL